MYVDAWDADLNRQVFCHEQVEVGLSLFGELDIRNPLRFPSPGNYMG
jgi:hypothetical protein